MPVNCVVIIANSNNIYEDYSHIQNAEKRSSSQQLHNDTSKTAKHKNGHIAEISLLQNSYRLFLNFDVFDVSLSCCFNTSSGYSTRKTGARSQPKLPNFTFIFVAVDSSYSRINVEKTYQIKTRCKNDVMISLH